jgi:plasmid stabilization system protein ParE
MAQIIWSMAETQQRLEALRKAYPRGAKAAAVEVGARLLDDCLTKSPTPESGTVPMAAHQGGTLRSRWDIGVIADEKHAEVQVTFDTAYAAVMHEGGWLTGRLAGVRIKNWSTPGNGPKFIEGKLRAYKAVYLELFAQLLRRNTGT